MKKQEETPQKLSGKTYKTKFTPGLVDDAVERVEEKRFFLHRQVYDMVAAYMFRYMWGDKMYDLEDE